VRDNAAAERQAMAALARGDRAALGQLIRRHGPGLRRFAAGMLRNADDAEDLVQEVFLRAWRAADRYDPDLGAVSTWLYRIASRLAIDRNRRTTLRRFLGLEAAPDPLDDSPGPEATLAARQELAQIRARLERLPDRQRRALLMRAAGGLSTAEIALALGISAGAVEQLLVRARAGLRATQAGE
jgi:RNA polymerase sigma-70 factor (ECF subfamily)